MVHSLGTPGRPGGDKGGFRQGGTMRTVCHERPWARPPRLAILLATAWLAACALAFPGCRSTRTQYHPAESAAGQTQIDDRLTPKAEIEELIAPFQREMEAEMGEVLAWCPENMRTGRPEGNLGALIADFVLARAQRDAEVPVEACILNNGGLRVPWSEGPITLGLVYEVMPFDNDIVLLRLTGAQVRAVANELAARSGEPVAGIEFEIRDEEAVDLEVAGDPLEERDYWIATNSYLADGGGGMPTLWDAREQLPLGVLIRDAIVDAARGYGSKGSSPDGSRPGTLPRPRMGRIRGGR